MDQAVGPGNVSQGQKPHGVDELVAGKLKTNGSNPDLRGTAISYNSKPLPSIGRYVLDGTRGIPLRSVPSPRLFYHGVSAESLASFDVTVVGYIEGRQRHSQCTSHQAILRRASASPHWEGIRPFPLVYALFRDLSACPMH